jgi:hypothetical protein
MKMTIRLNFGSMYPIHFTREPKRTEHGATHLFSSLVVLKSVSNSLLGDVYISAEDHVSFQEFIQN